MSEREARVHKVSNAELAAAGLEVPTLDKKRARKVRPAGGMPKMGDEVKIVHCGNRAVIGSFGKVIKVEPLDTTLGRDALLTVRVTLHIGESGKRWVRFMEVQCFAAHVNVWRSLQERIPDIGKKENATADGIDRLMRQGFER